MQKLPASLQSNTSAGEWFTSSVDMREDKDAESLAVDNKLGRSLSGRPDIRTCYCSCFADHGA